MTLIRGPSLGGFTDSPVAARNNPWAQHLRFLWVASNPRKELAYGGTATVTGSPIATMTPRGLGYASFSIGGPYFNFPAPKNATSTSWTLLVHFAKVGAGLQGLFCSMNGAANPVDMRIRVTGTLRCFFAGTSIDGTTAIPFNDAGVALCTATPTEQRIYWRGKLENTTTVAATPTTLASATDFRVLSASTATDNSVLMVAWIDRPVTSAEAAYLSLFPSALLAPRYRRPLAASYSGIPTLSAAAVTAITATTAKPRVTVTF